MTKRSQYMETFYDVINYLPLYLNSASVEFAEDLPVPARQTDARRQGRRRTYDQVLATQIVLVSLGLPTLWVGPRFR